MPCDSELQFDVASNFVVQVYRAGVRLLLLVLLIRIAVEGFRKVDLVLCGCRSILSLSCELEFSFLWQEIL